MGQDVQGLEGPVKWKAPEHRQGKLSLPDVNFLKLDEPTRNACSLLPAVALQNQ